MLAHQDSPSGLPPPGSHQPERTVKNTSFRPVILWFVGAVLLTAGLAEFKNYRMDQFQIDGHWMVQNHHGQFKNLFQANFYFFFQEKFVPEVQIAIEEFSALKRVQFISKSGQVLFDSNFSDRESTEESQATALISNMQHERPELLVRNFYVDYHLPAEEYSIIYRLHAQPIQSQMIKLFVIGLMILTVLVALLHWVDFRFWNRLFLSLRQHLWNLRAKMVFTIVSINLITGALIYYTLSEMQLTDERDRIERDSVLFSRFSMDKIMGDFRDTYYFYYQDRFLPSIRSVVAANENLVGIKIISAKTKGILFDSEGAGDEPVPSEKILQRQVDISAKTEKQLASHGFVVQEKIRDQEPLLSVMTQHQNEYGESLYYMEHLFSYRSLYRSIQRIRNNILLDLVPSVLIGFLIAMIFSQLLTRSIRRLSSGMRQVADGDYSVKIAERRSDEIGSLLTAFNQMTGELKKKTELKKYISQSTYRQVMESPELPDGARLRGTRVYATILFSDIRNFVSHCESLDAEEVTTMLNDYFSEMVEVVYKYGGEVDKFIGDAILAVFYSNPDQRSFGKEARQGETDHSASALHAIYCSLEMRDRLKEFNRIRVQQGKGPIEIGVGITQGEIISGPIGAKDRMDFTVIGDVVNLANRIESVSKVGKHTRVVFSHHVEQRVRGLLEYEEIPDQKIRGKEELVRVFELVRIKDLEEILRLLDSSQVNDRLRGVDLLGQTRNNDAVPVLIGLLSDEEDLVRNAVIPALALFGDSHSSEIVEALFERLKIEKSEKVISAIIAALGRVCHDDRILELRTYLKSSNERIVANVIEAIGSSSQAEARDLILPFLSSRHNRVKANAAMALFASGHIEVLDTLKPMMMHSDPMMRSSAAFAIGELTLLATQNEIIEKWKSASQLSRRVLGEFQECVPMLIRLLNDPEPMVKRQAITALGKIRDKGAILPIIDSIDLNRDSQEILKEVTQALRSMGSHRLVREVIERLN